MPDHSAFVADRLFPGFFLVRFIAVSLRNVPITFGIFFEWISRSGRSTAVLMYLKDLDERVASPA